MYWEITYMMKIYIHVLYINFAYITIHIFLIYLQIGVQDKQGKH